MDPLTSRPRGVARGRERCSRRQVTPEPVLLELVQPQPVRLEPVLVQELVQEREQVVRLESAPPRKRCTQQGRSGGAAAR